MFCSPEYCNVAINQSCNVDWQMDDSSDRRNFDLDNKGRTIRKVMGGGEKTEKKSMQTKNV
jgi:hypothetical protein